MDRKKKEELTEEEKILKESKSKSVLVTKERNRVSYFRSRHDAAIKIQRAWKMYRFRTKGVLKNARDAIKQKRLDAGELEWKKQIAACTIQLAWRRYHRARLMDQLAATNSRLLHVWDPDVVSARQRALVSQIYSEHLYVPEWHPTLKSMDRPYWYKYQPSPAALSFNFAIDQYYNQALQGMIDEELQNQPNPRIKSVYSYNMMMAAAQSPL